MPVLETLAVSCHSYNLHCRPSAPAGNVSRQAWQTPDRSLSIQNSINPVLVRYQYCLKAALRSSSSVPWHGAAAQPAQAQSPCRGPPSSPRARRPPAPPGTAHLQASAGASLLQPPRSPPTQWPLDWRRPLAGPTSGIPHHPVGPCVCICTEQLPMNKSGCQGARS